MSLGTLVYSALTNAAGIAALVATRVYPTLLPQNPTYPAISYQRISNTPQLGSTDLRETRYQIDCWGRTYASAQALAVVVKATMEEYRDASQTPGIKMSQIVNELDDYDPEVGIHRVIVDVIFTTTGD